VLIGRTLSGRAVVRTVEKAMEVVGGAGFYRALGLERLFRDVQAARYHPLQEKPQTVYTGRFALGLDVNG
jgi:acyl-CoA dehydrogenase